MIPVLSNSESITGFILTIYTFRLLFATAAGTICKIISKQHITTVEKYDYTMCYLAAVSHFDRDGLLKICQEIVSKHELAPVGGRIYEANEFDHFVNDLQGSEYAIVPMLQGLAVKKGAGVTIQFFINERMISDNAGTLITIDTRKRRALADSIIATNHDGVDWYKLIAKVAGIVSRGRPLKTKKAVEMKRAQHAKHGLVDAWKLKEGDADWMTHANIWSNIKTYNAKEAQALFPNEQLRKASPRTITTIFGGRNECAALLKAMAKTK